jgi:hypothetical protein
LEPIPPPEELPVELLVDEEVEPPVDVPCELLVVELAGVEPVELPVEVATELLVELWVEPVEPPVDVPTELLPELLLEEAPEEELELPVPVEDEELELPDEPEQADIRRVRVSARAARPGTTKRCRSFIGSSPLLLEGGHSRRIDADEPDNSRRTEPPTPGAAKTRARGSRRPRVAVACGDDAVARAMRLVRGNDSFHERGSDALLALPNHPPCHCRCVGHDRL